MEDKVKSILLVSLSCVGDAVMTTPVLQSLHDSCPHAKIDVISDSRSAILYTHCPYKQTIILKDKSKFLRGALDLVSKTRKNNYDLIVDLRTDGLAYLFKGKTRLTKWGSKPYGEHAVENLMGVISKVHGNRRIHDTRVWLTEQEEEFAEEALALLPSGTWVVLVPDNLDQRKVWPEQNYLKLIESFEDKIDGIILEGSLREKESTDRIARELKVPVVNMAGKTNLLQAAAMIKRASVFVGSDSGLGHIAGAVSTPAMLFFSVDKPERVLPWRAKAEFLVSEDENTRSITVDRAVAKLDKLLKSI